ncbi:MAG TPA: hypothetical protein VFO40_03960 [Chthoniobacterales bacterium]|nr:hypothetical protein [Chthoniobacterales bacterium]
MKKVTTIATNRLQKLQKLTIGQDCDNTLKRTDSLGANRLCAIQRAAVEALQKRALIGKTAEPLATP